METIELKYPTDGGLKEIKIRRPKVRDQLAAEKAKGTDAEKEINFFANLCELSPAEIESLDLFDYGKIQAVYKSFLS